MKKRFLIITLAVLSVACKSDEQQALEQQIAEFDQLTEQTMEVHDEVMPDMGTLMELSAQIDERLEQEDLDEATTEELITAKVALEQSHDDMMAWMRDYSTTFPYEAPLPETSEQLEEQEPKLMEFKLAIDQIKTSTQMAITDAESLLAREQ